MEILCANDRIAYGHDEDRYYIMSVSEIPDEIRDLIGPILGTVTDIQQKIIENAADVYEKARWQAAGLPGRDMTKAERDALIARVSEVIEATPNPIKAGLYWTNLQNPMIADFEAQFRRENGIPSHNCPLSTPERVRMDIEFFERAIPEICAFYARREESEHEKTA